MSRCGPGQVDLPPAAVLDAARQALWSAVAHEMLAADPSAGESAAPPSPAEAQPQAQAGVAQPPAQTSHARSARILRPIQAHDRKPHEPGKPLQSLKPRPTATPGRTARTAELPAAVDRGDGQRGRQVDRWPVRPLMIGCDVISALLYASLPAAAWLGVLSTGQVVAVALLAGTANVFFATAYGLRPTRSTCHSWSPRPNA